jgi:hypothetical protein
MFLLGTTQMVIRLSSTAKEVQMFLQLVYPYEDWMNPTLSTGVFSTVKYDMLNRVQAILFAINKSAPRVVCNLPWLICPTV